MISYCIEASSDVGGVAVFDGEALVSEEEFAAVRGGTMRLFELLQEMRARCGNPGRIIVGLGPGSYSGVRIAISAAIGFNVATGCELLGVCSLAALGEGEYLAIGDARRESFYHVHVKEGRCVELPAVMSAEELKVTLAGHGTDFPVLTTAAIPLFPQAQVAHPKAHRLLDIARRQVWARDDLEPIYLREAYITQPKQRIVG